MFRSHGIVKDAKHFKKSHVPNWYYQQQVLGFNYRMTDIQASLGISQLNRVDKFIKRRAEIANIYIDALSDQFETIDKKRTNLLKKQK